MSGAAPAIPSTIVSAAKAEAVVLRRVTWPTSHDGKVDPVAGTWHAYVTRGNAGSVIVPVIGCPKCRKPIFLAPSNEAIAELKRLSVRFHRSVPALACSIDTLGRLNIPVQCPHGLCSFKRPVILDRWKDMRPLWAVAYTVGSGTRIEFWKKSLRFIASAPVFGHGTGSIVEQFKHAEAGQGASAIPSSNPHNQTFAVGIQLGVIGMAVLWAMWIAQLLVFRGRGLTMWIGLVVVTANIVGSLFNSFIFDFTEGWIYVFGVGVVTGMVRRSSDADADQALAELKR